MTRFRDRLLMAIYGLLIAGGLTFGATQLFAQVDCNGPGQIGTCPPYNDESCDDACDMMFGTPGGCIFGCCTCATR
jgi:hypothetical protein